MLSANACLLRACLLCPLPVARFVSTAPPCMFVALQYATPFFLTLFAYNLEPAVVCRVLDALLVLGCE